MEKGVLRKPSAKIYETHTMTCSSLTMGNFVMFTGLTHSENKELLIQNTVNSKKSIIPCKQPFVTDLLAMTRLLQISVSRPGTKAFVCFCLLSYISNPFIPSSNPSYQSQLLRGLECSRKTTFFWILG